MLSSIIWTPLLFGLIGLLVPKRFAAWTAVLGTADAAGRGAVLVEMDRAARAAAEWGAPPDPFPGLDRGGTGRAPRSAS